jgi:4'-phosphopantetheinyl transferase
MNFQPARASEDRTAWPVENIEVRRQIVSVSGAGFELVAVNLDSGLENLQAAEHELSADERERANRFVFERDRRRFVVARSELRRLLGARMEMPPEDIEFLYGRYGKPELPPGFSQDDLRFNTSHSDGVAIYAFTGGRRIGIDIEAIRPMQDADEVAARCFSPHEIEAYRRLDSRDRLSGFFNCWTRKEAFVKALGDGLGYPLSDFDVSLVPGQPAKILRVGDRVADNCGWQLNDIDDLPGFAAAIVIESPTN